MAIQTFNGFVDYPAINQDVDYVIAGISDASLERLLAYFATDHLRYKPFYGFIDYPMPQEPRQDDGLAWPTGVQRFGNEL